MSSGKTTVSSWLVQEQSTRKHFQQIAWLSLGQDATLQNLQNLLFLQLTGEPFDGDSTPEGRIETLKQAMCGKDILLVLDDEWTNDLERGLNLIDTTTESKVLISSRIRTVLGTAAAIVDIGLPSEEEATKMLLVMAGLDVEMRVAPPEAIAVVRKCNCLPLALGMMGRLIRETIGESTDWSGVVELMTEEWAESGQEAPVLNIIRTSLHAIKGPHAQSILRLFRAFAVVPEDHRTPLEVVTLLFEAEDEQPLVKPPSLLNIRRWLKALIDRNLILGTVDRPSLHDIVRDFVVSSKSEEARRATNCRLVELLRARRPPGGWDADATDSVSLYLSSAATLHIRGAWSPEWSKDEQAISWLEDFVDGKQDALPLFAAEALGAERATQLACAAEHECDWWVASLRWAALANAEHRRAGYAKSLPLLGKSAVAIERVQPVLAASRTPTHANSGKHHCTAQEKGRLELSVLLMSLKSYNTDLDTQGYLSRLTSILDVDMEAADPFSLINVVQFTDMIPPYFGGNYVAWGEALLKLLQISRSFLETVHESDITRHCQLLAFVVSAPSWDSICEAPGFEWDDCYGEEGSLLLYWARNYDHERMHLAMKFTSFNMALAFPGCSVGLALHYGNLAAADETLDLLLPAVRTILADYSGVTDIFEIHWFKTSWVFWLFTLGRRAEAKEVLHAGPFDSLEAM